MGHISVSHDGVHGIIFISKADGHLFVRSLGGLVWPDPKRKKVWPRETSKHIIETRPFFEKEGIMGHEYLQHISSSDPP